MYLVRIYDGQNLITINDTTTYTQERITGQVTQGINTIDNFTFNIYPNNIGYNQIQQWKSVVTVLNERTNQYEFRGRVLLIENQMDSNGLVFKRVTCENDFGFFHDSYTRYKKYENVSVKEFLEDILENHNKQVTEDKRFLLGNVEFSNNLQREVAYISTWECLKTRLFENSELGGELVVRYENDKRYIDYVKERGTIVIDSPIEVASNMISLSNEDDFSGFCTRLIPLGSKLTDSEERVTISTVNNGRDYLEDADGVNRYGVIESVVTWDDVTEPSNLLKRGQDYLKDSNKITRKFSIDAIDLSLLGLNPSSYQVANYYQVINQLLGIGETLRVVEKRFSIEYPESASLTFGSLFDNAQDYQKNAIQNALEAKEIASITSGQVNNNNIIIGDINTAVTNQQIQINNNSNTINNQNNDIGILKNNVANIFTELGVIDASIGTLDRRVDDLDARLNTTDTKVIDIESKMSRMAKRIMLEVF